MVNEEKIAQIAGYILFRIGKPVPLVKLMKLIYLADRNSIERYEEPMTDGQLSSMKFGPVVSPAYDFAKSNNPSSAWARWVSRSGNDLSYNGEAQRPEEFGKLSPAIVEVLDDISDEFCDMNHWAVVDKTHELEEYTNPGDSSLPIYYRDIFEALGWSVADAREAERDILSKQEAVRRLKAG